ncbi:5-formyltetrahydrofolate cyclo-ligase [Prevotella dentasini]
MNPSTEQSSPQSLGEKPSDGGQLSKSSLRREIRARKKQFTPDGLIALSQPILKRLAAHPRYRQATTVLLYHSLPDEVYTHDFVAQAVAEGKTVLLPVVVSDTEMEIRRYTGPDDLSISSFGILEPSGEPFTDFAQIEFALVPGMSFDSHRNRLGRGKGYYDRFLPNIPQAYKLGICFDFQKLDEIPADKYDKKVDEVL